jgi:hypothetical protein
MLIMIIFAAFWQGFETLFFLILQLLYSKKMEQNWEVLVWSHSIFSRFLTNREKITFAKIFLQLFLNKSEELQIIIIRWICYNLIYLFKARIDTFRD